MAWWITQTITSSHLGNVISCTDKFIYSTGMFKSHFSQVERWYRSVCLLFYGSGTDQPELLQLKLLVSRLTGRHRLDQMSALVYPYWHAELHCEMISSKGFPAQLGGSCQRYVHSLCTSMLLPPVVCLNLSLRIHRISYGQMCLAYFSALHNRQNCSADVKPKVIFS